MMQAITDDDLQAYADAQLDAARRPQVEAYLAEHPDARARVQQIRDQAQALHRLYDGVLNEPLPPRLRSRLAPAPKAAFWPQGLAAGLAWLGCGMIAGWFAHTAAPPQPQLAFARNALAAHVLYSAEKRHPVEVAADQEAHLVAWLSKRLELPIHAPDLQPQGFALLGGRLLPGPDAPLAQLMYQSAQGERLTLTVRHAAESSGSTGFKLMEHNGVTAFYWVDRQYGYALSGAISQERMRAVAHAVDRQLQ